MQGYKRPAEREPETVVEQTGITQNAFTEAPTPGLSDAERAELEELRALKVNRDSKVGDSAIPRPPHEG